MTEEAPGTDLSQPLHLDFHTVDLRTSSQVTDEIRQLLQGNGLELEQDVSSFVTCREDGRLVGCAGLHRDVVKDVAVVSDLQGAAVSLRLGSEVLKLAVDAGFQDLFLYCKPDNVERFRGWAFFPLVEVPGTVTLMENNPLALPQYCEKLAGERRKGGRIGSAVLNANPFTLGHRHLIDTAAKDCDWVHVFVVKEEAAQFSYRDRLRLVREGLADLPNVLVHEGSKYIISRETFPGYFLENKAKIESSFSAVDLLIFRQYVAPALGINRRYVGTEPSDTTTNSYNEAMKHWLSEAPSEAPRIETVVVERLSVDGAPVSASTVREKLAADDMGALEKLAPPSTLAFLRERASEPSTTG